MKSFHFKSYRVFRTMMRSVSYGLLLCLMVIQLSGCSLLWSNDDEDSSSSSPTVNAESVSKEETSCPHTVWDAYNNIAHQCTSCGLREEHNWVSRNDKVYCSVCFMEAEAKPAEESTQPAESSTESSQESSQESSGEVSVVTAYQYVTPYTALKDRRVGDFVSFGCFEQDNNTSNGSEPITWTVLAIEGNRALLISTSGLDCRQYHQNTIPVYWEGSDIRAWLNSTFYQTAFSSTEQSAIAYTHLTNEGNDTYRSNGGDDTYDYVFLLSYDEAKEYFANDTARMCYPTEYCIAHECYEDEKTQAGWWWLRSPGKADPPHACIVNWEGAAHNGGYTYNHAYGMIRPAIWVYFS